MLLQRGMGELEDIPLNKWSLDELAFNHQVMSQMVGFLNAEGVCFHNTIINEIESRGGLRQKH
ncbi:MAG TPA: hypothetical protein VJ824_07650 [Bacillota bacterium]|nr:hypothetical protein [Bacillota bacterium]